MKSAVLSSETWKNSFLGAASLQPIEIHKNKGEKAHLQREYNSFLCGAER
jgi:hypothetical protein